MLLLLTSDPLTDILLFVGWKLIGIGNGFDYCKFICEDGFVITLDVGVQPHKFMNLIIFSKIFKIYCENKIE